MAKKILIIEDERYLLDMYAMKFKQCGYQVVVAANGKEGLEVARKKKPDLILLDLVMPVMDGYEFLEKFKQDKKLKNIKVYIWSNLGQAAEIEKGLQGGADGYLIKTKLTPKQLASKVEKILGEDCKGGKK